LNFEIGEFDLVDLVRRAAKEVTPPETPDRVRLTADDDLPRARGDDGRTSQAVTNLLSNALKFSPADAWVEVEIRAEDDMLRVDVRDHGPGIPAEDQSKLFERFARLPGSGHRPKGTGLGLYIAKHIVETQGGTISVESAPSEGSTFSFTIPAVR